MFFIDKKKVGKNRWRKWSVLAGGVCCFFIFSSPLSAQFNNSFDIEKHSLADENFFDWKAYQQPVAWRYQWYTTSSGLSATVGSLSQEQFFFDQELRFVTVLSPSLSFSYFQSREELYRATSLYQEVGFRYGTDYGVSISGFPTHEKKGNTVGIALSYGQYYSYRYIKIGRLMQNLMYNEKNKSDEKNTATDEYAKTPNMDEIEIQYRWDNGILLKADLEKEHKAVLKGDDGSYEKSYIAHNYEVTVDWFFQESQMIGIQYRDDVEYRKNFDTSGTSKVTTKEQKLTYGLTDLYYFNRVDSANEVTVGYLSSHFKNKIDAAVLLDTYDFDLGSDQAYLFWQRTRTPHSKMNYGVQGGRYIFKKENGGVIEDDKNGIQLKLTVGIEFYDLGQYRLLGNSTWDLDTFLYRQWDGGNIQVQVYF